MSAFGDFVARAFRTSPKNVPTSSAAAMAHNDGGIGSADRGRVGKPRASMYRAWSEHSEWIRAAINIRKTQVSQSSWDIAKFDPEGPEPSEKLIKQVKAIFTSPNPRSESWRSFIEPVIEDILVLDAGCLHGRELVVLSDGSKLPIGTIVNERLTLEVMAFNEETGELVPRRITGWYKNAVGERRWVRVNHRHARKMGGHSRMASWFTHDHQLLTEAGWREVHEIGDLRVATSERQPNAAAREVFDGTMLGDASLVGRGLRRQLSISHAEKQAAWAGLKAASIGLQMARDDIRARVTTIAGRVSHGTPQVRFRSSFGGWLEEQAERWLRPGKRVPLDLVLTDMVIAVWFMDDGHRHTTRDRFGNRSHISYFNTHGFSVQDQQRLVSLLVGHGIECHLQSAGEYTRIYVTTRGTRSLVAAIGRFVPPSMRYKIGDGAPAYDPQLWSECGTEPYFDHVDVVEGNPAGGRNAVPKWAYCIDVEEDHNFIASNLVAHNCVEKDRTLRGDLVGLWAADGAKIRVNSYWDGSDPDEPRYYWYPDNYERASFKNEDMLYIMESPATYRVVGLSKLETLKQAIDSELLGHQYNHRQVLNAAPDGMLDLGEGARPEQVDAFRSYWESEVAGRGAMAFIGGSKNAQFIPFRASNRDMQFLEWQLYLVRKICAVFGLSPQDLGVTADVNRATADTFAEQSEDRGLRPLLGLLGEYLTREIVWDPTFGGPDNNLSFRFTRLNLKESLSRAQVNSKSLAGVPWKTINEARRDDGLEPKDGDVYNQLVMVGPTGVVSLDEVPTASESAAAKSPAPAPPNA